ncbi:MAG: signal peptide peptidase SppA [Acidobacteria bacterium]|nr:signal peptide peptidase SppA [Acidobacteriota bacterium]
MRKFLVGILCGLLLAGVVGVVLIFAVIRFGASESAPVVASNSTLWLKLEGGIAEAPPDEMPLPFLEAQSAVTVQELWSALRAAATDSRIKAVVLTPRGVSAGWAKLDEVRSAIVEFKKSGKPVLCWLRTPGAREYYLATAADKIYLAEQDMVNVKGLGAEITYYKGTLDKLGVQMEFETAGKFKDAGDSYRRTAMSPETREVLGSMLDGIYGTIISAIAQGRKKNPAEIRTMMDDGPFLGQKALALGLVDGLLYEDQFRDELRKTLGGGEIANIGAREYARESGRGKGPRFGLVVAAGSILRGHAGGFGESEAIMSEDFVKTLRAAREDESLRGVIVRIDSPGGDAIASDDILREMKLLSAKKPIVISMSDVAASGGYYIAATGDPIVAYPNTITGSIGVIYGKPNLKGLYDKIGVTKDSLARGRNALIDSDYGPMSEPTRAKLREGIMSTYQGFLKRVADARKMKVEEVDALGQGRAWLGSQGKDRKLVDELGGLDKAISLLKAKAKLGPDESIRLVPYPPRRSFVARFLTKSTESVADREVRAWLKGHGLAGFEPGLLHGGMMQVMPYTVEFK